MATDTEPRLPKSSEAPAAAIGLNGVSVRLGDRLALRDVSCNIEAGSFVGLVGPNGSGKSTLLRAVLGLLPLAAGEVRIDGRAPSDARDRVAYLPQRQQLELDQPLRAWDVAMMGRLRHSGWLRPPSRHDREVVTWALEQVGLSDRRNSPIGEMSFGQQQRVLFARALAQEGSILLLDEPMNGVDQTTQELFLKLLADFHAEGKTIVMATHDLGQVATVCDTLCVLDGRLVAFGSVEDTLTEDVLRQAYGVHLHFVAGRVAPDQAEILEDVHHHDIESHGHDRLA